MRGRPTAKEREKDRHDWCLGLSRSGALAEIWAPSNERFRVKEDALVILWIQTLNTSVLSFDSSSKRAIVLEIEGF